MAGAMGAAGVVFAAAALTGGLLLAASAAATGQRLASAADAAALAAADAASGAAPGIPCERADQLADAFGAVVETCDLEELIATVTVSIRVGAVTARASARAGPPS